MVTGRDSGRQSQRSSASSKRYHRRATNTLIAHILTLDVIVIGTLAIDTLFATVCELLFFSHRLQQLQCRQIQTADLCRMAGSPSKSYTAATGRPEVLCAALPVVPLSQCMWTDLDVRRFNEGHKTWFYVNTKAPGGAKSQWTQ